MAILAPVQRFRAYLSQLFIGCNTLFIRGTRTRYVINRFDGITRILLRTHFFHASSRFGKQRTNAVLGNTERLADLVVVAVF